MNHYFFQILIVLHPLSRPPFIYLTRKVLQCWIMKIDFKALVNIWLIILDSLESSPCVMYSGTCHDTPITPTPFIPPHPTTSPSPPPSTYTLLYKFNSLGRNIIHISSRLLTYAADLLCNQFCLIQELWYPEADRGSQVEASPRHFLWQFPQCGHHL